MRGGNGEGFAVEGSLEWGVCFAASPAEVHEVTLVRINGHADRCKHSH